MDINKIIQDAKTKEKWSANHQFNYGPIEHLEKEIFNDGHDGIHFNLFYKNVSKVADALTFFAYEFRKYDIYVRITDLFYVFGRTFPEVNEDTIVKWAEGFKSPEQIIIY